MKLYRLFFYTFKRYIKMPLFAALILLLPILTIAHVLIKSSDSAIDTEGEGSAAYIDYYFDDTKEDPDHEFDRMPVTEDSMYYFHECGSKNELIKDVASGHAECGYIIPSDILDILSTGDKEESITVYISPQSAQSAIVNESVYASVFNRLAPVLLDNYLRKHSAIKDDMKNISEEKVYELFEQYTHDGSTFSINIESGKTDVSEENVKAQPHSSAGIMGSALRGLFAVLILLAGFIGVLKYYDISESPVFSKFRFRIVNITVPMIIFTVTAEFCMLILHICPPTELFDIVSYLLINTLFLTILSYIIKSRSVFCAVMPVYLLGCLVFTPVFIDAGALLPLVRKISVFFTPHWYL